MVADEGFTVFVYCSMASGWIDQHWLVAVGAIPRCGVQLRQGSIDQPCGPLSPLVERLSQSPGRVGGGVTEGQTERQTEIDGGTDRRIVRGRGGDRL